MPLELLTRGLLAKRGISVPVGADTPVKIMLFGEGNFLRAFAVWLFEHLNASGRFAGAVRVVQPISKGMAAELARQDGLYTLILRGMADGTARETIEVVSSVVDCLNPYEEWGRFLAAAREPALRYVVSNTTEAGIIYLDQPMPAGRTPETFPAKVAALLTERHRALGGGQAAGLVFLPCELIERNGAALRDAVLRHLQAWRCDGKLLDWAAGACRFHNTLVDRIVTGYPAAEAGAICDRLGYEDRLLVTGELFHFWAIEGDERLRSELPFADIGLNVAISDDITPYRDRKVRVLNGSHTGNVLAAFLAGLDTVGLMMDDPLFGRAARDMLFTEILPGVKLPAAEREAYAEATLERFRNPYVRHELISIALNSVSKWKVRILPSLKDYLADSGRLPRRLAFSLAALIVFYRGRREGGEYVGTREKGDYPIRDDAAVVDAFASAWGTFAEDPPSLARHILANTALWGEDLTALPGLADAVACDIAGIVRQGAAAALAGLNRT